MFSLPNMPSTTSVLSTYTAFTASAMLARAVLNEIHSLTLQFIPQQLRDRIQSRVDSVFSNLSSQMTLVIDEYKGISINEVYQASESYLSTRVGPSTKQLRVGKDSKEKKISVTIDKGEKIVDTYGGIKLVWEFVCIESKMSTVDYENYGVSLEKTETKSFHLSFHRKHYETVLNEYLPYVVAKAKAMEEVSKVVKLHSYGHFAGSHGGGPWGSINLDHPSTFDTLAMDPELKKELMDDLDRFVSRKEYYRRVGKAWKRGYLLYGPPGTGKSSLVAAMANYLKFDIYDLELSNLHANADLRNILVSTANRSIIVIEDIDCTIQMQDRNAGRFHDGDSQLTLSGLLNFVDGLWSNCGDGRIIVFTTNHKDKIDPALLRPGRMDMHIHMSYCTPSGFRILASNYLSIKSHHLFPEIDNLINEVEVTPAEAAEELMKSNNANRALAGLREFLQRKKSHMLMKEEKVDSTNEQTTEIVEDSLEKEDRLEKKRGTRNARSTRKKSKTW